MTVNTLGKLKKERWFLRKLLVVISQGVPVAHSVQTGK